MHRNCLLICTLEILLKTYLLTYLRAFCVIDVWQPDRRLRLTLSLHGVCMLRECIYGEYAHEQHVRRTLTLTHMITAYSVSGNVVRVRILICATRQKPCRKRVYRRLPGYIIDVTWHMWGACHSLSNWLIHWQPVSVTGWWWMSGTGWRLQAINILPVDCAYSA